MPSGVYVRTEECNKAHRVKRNGSGVYQRTPEELKRLKIIGYQDGCKHRLGVCHSEKAKLKMSESHNGHIHSENQKRKISLSLLGNKRSCKSGKGLWNNQEYRREWYRKNYAKNIEKLRKYGSARSALRRITGSGKGSKPIIKTIQEVYENNIKQYGTLTCYLCLKPIEFRQDSVEHKIPLCRGGNNEYENLAIAHLVCNKRKSKKTDTEFKNIIQKGI